jgi:hypothetical protein
MLAKLAVIIADFDYDVYGLRFFLLPKTFKSIGFYALASLKMVIPETS